MLSVCAAISDEDVLREVSIILPPDYWAVGVDVIVESPLMLTEKVGLRVS